MYPKSPKSSSKSGYNKMLYNFSIVMFSENYYQVAIHCNVIIVKQNCKYNVWKEKNVPHIDLMWRLSRYHVSNAM